MDLYHSWVYVNILNAKWLIWSIVIIVLAFNILAPIITWTVINGKGLPFVNSKKKRDNNSKENNEVAGGGNT